MSDTIRGAGHVGPSFWIGYRGRWPIATLTVGPDSVEFRMWPIEYAFPKSSMILLQKRGIRGWHTLSIVHANPDYSKSVLFRPGDFAALESVLARYGYRVTEGEPQLGATEGMKYSSTVSNIAYIAGTAGAIAAAVAAFVAYRLSG